MPLILLATAAALFMLYTDPAYQNTKTLAVEGASYDEALDTSQELRKLRDELIARRNTFGQEDLQKLQRMIPDNVDNIRLIIDINGIAARHGLTLKDVKLGTISDSVQARSPLAVGASGDQVGSVTLGFTVAASYDEFLMFLQDVEHSLRLLDIEDLSFTAATPPADNDYHFSVRTYWLH